MAAGAAAAGIVGAALAAAPVAPPVTPFAAAAAVALAVAILPRIAWLAAAAALCVWLALPHVGLAGVALVAAAAAACVPPLILRGKLLWSVPALAPLLGLAGMAPLFVVLAGLAPTAWRRAGLAAAGFVWLAIAEVANGHRLLFGAPAGARSLHLWQGSASAATRHVLWPLVSSGALAPALVWAALAAILPFVVRGHSLTLDILGAVLWAAALVAAHKGLAQALADPEARGLWAGALLAPVAAVAAVGAGLVRRPVEPPALP